MLSAHSKLLVKNTTYKKICGVTSRFCGNFNKSHYEILELPSNCTAKQIRESFIKLSKQYHPDKNKEKDIHSKYVKIVAAYNTLSKPDSRRNYDLGLSIDNIQYQETHGRRKPVYDTTFWEYRDKTQDKFYEQKPYYGIKGVKKVSNFVIVVFCCIFTAIGVGLQVLTIRNSLTLKRSKMLEVSAEAEKNLNKSKNIAEENGNLRQIELFKERMRKRNLITTSDE